MEDGSIHEEWIEDEIYQMKSRELMIKYGLIKDKSKFELVDFIWCLVGNIDVKEVDSKKWRRNP